jgi:hypothetical protein
VVAASKLEVTPVVAGAGAQVVTAVSVKAGDEVQAGQVLVAVSGRPLIVLPGALPGYRDLKPADSGTDVRQLQAALKAMGHSTGADKSGFLGAGTKAALRALYIKIGYDAPSTGGPGGAGDRQASQAANDAVEEAQLAVDAMKRRISGGETAKPGEEPLDDQLARLRQRLERAQQARSDLIARTGTMLPLAEFVFVPSFPARVTALVANVGDPVKAPLITLASGHLAVLVKARADQTALLRPGMPVQLVAENVGQQAQAEVAAVGELTPGPEGGAPYHPVTIAASQPLPAAWANLDVRATITAAQTSAEVLVVPLSAVSSGADGRTTVSVLDTAGRVTRIEVRAGVSGDGFVEITPISGGLAAGDKVIVSAVK